MKNIKRIVSLLLCILMIGATFAGCASKLDNKLQYEVENGEASIVKYTDSTDRTVIEVPDEIDGVPVTKIANFGLFNAESLETIKIGKNVKEIGEWSMTNNYHLKEFVVDEANPYFCSVDGVLFSKDMKTIIYFPPGKGIDGYDGYGVATNKTTYEIPEGVETIATKCFYKCYYVEDIKIPSTVKRIEEKAFHRTSALNHIDLPEALEYIGKDAFSYDFSENYQGDEMTTITIPANVKEIGDYAFFQCERVNKVVMMPKESEIKLGEVWSPSTKGKPIKTCEILWQNN